MKFSPPSWLLYSLLIPALLGMIFIGSRAGNALSMGGNEGMELSRALLLSERPAAVARVEHDQPWLYPKLLSAGFKMFGPSAATARLFSLVSATAMLLALGRLLFQAVGGLGSLLAGILLFSTQGMLSLSLAALPGLPAIAWAVVAVAFSYNPSHPPNWKKLAISGAVWACAIHIQLTALIVWPAFVALAFRQWGWKSAGICLCPWGIGFVTAFLMLALPSPTFDWKLLSKPVWNQSGFHWSALWLNPGLLSAASLGVWLTVRRKAPAPLLFASVWFATVALLAGMWGAWPEQDIGHFYVPLAILGSAGFAATVAGALAELRPASNQSTDNGTIRFHDRNGLNALGAITIFAFWVGFTVPDFVSDLTRLNHLPSVKHDGLCLSIREHAQATRWCYTRFPEYAFAGSVIIPPELTALPAPEWLERHPASEPALALAQKYQPEQLLLAGDVEMHNPAWAAWTTNHYVLVDQDGQKELWVSRRLQPKQIQPSNDLLRKLGL